MIVDTVVLGDTPFVAAVQDILRTLGRTTFLVYTGNTSLRYAHSTPVRFPHVVCRYKFASGNNMSPLHRSRYQQHFRDRSGGDSNFYYGLLTRFGKDDILLRLSRVQEKGLIKRGAVIGEPSKIALTNRFIVVNGETIHFGTLIVSETLKKFSRRLSTKLSFKSRDIGLLLEESVPMLSSVVKLGAPGSPGTVPLFSISRGFLWYHYYPDTFPQVNVKLQDFLKIPSYDTLSFSREMEAKNTVLVGPRAIWNTSLSLESELQRMVDVVEMSR